MGVKVKRNPPMPTEPITIQLMVTMQLKLDLEHFSSGHLLMCMADTERDIKQGEKLLGKAGAAIGGTMFVEVGSRLWTFDTLELFNAVQKAERHQYLIRYAKENASCQEQAALKKK